MVEISDDELQAAKGLLLPGPVHAHILQPPQHKIALGLAGKRRHADLQPLRRIGTGPCRRGPGGKADFPRVRLALKGRLRQLIDGLHEGRLPRIEQIKSHQPVHPRFRSQLQEGRIAVNRARLAVRHHAGIAYGIGEAIEKSPRLVLPVKADEAAHESKEREQPDKGKHRAGDEKAARNRILQLPDAGTHRHCQECGERKGQRNGNPARSRSHAGHLISTALRHLAPIPESFEYRRFPKFRIPLHSSKIYDMMPPPA